MIADFDRTDATTPTEEVRVGVSEMVEVSKIKIGERRRDDYGDIGELAQSIKEQGLLHPVGITEDYQLVYGGRRVRAVKSLGWSHIEAVRYGRMENLELRRKELAENMLRLDLDPLERDKTMIKYVEVTKSVMEEEAKQFPPGAGGNSNGTVGRPSSPTSRESVSRRTGIPTSTIGEATTHVEAVEKYPALLKVYKRKGDRVKAYRQLEAMEPGNILGRRDHAVAALEAGYTISQKSLAAYDNAKDANLGNVGVAYVPPLPDEAMGKAFVQFRDGTTGEEEKLKVVRVKRRRQKPTFAVEYEDKSARVIDLDALLKEEDYTKCTHCNGYGVHRKEGR